MIISNKRNEKIIKENILFLIKNKNLFLQVYFEKNLDYSSQETEFIKKEKKKIFRDQKLNFS
jgi:hypothetical protein